MVLLNILLYIYLLLRPYYFFGSGSMQISDIFLVLAFGIYILLSARNKEVVIKNVKRNKFYIFFLVLVFLINLIYFIEYEHISYVYSSLYYMFNLMVILVFSNRLENEKFLENMNKIIKLNIIIQLFMYIFGVGSYWGNTYRYMGTFNDPNQFGYYILISYYFIYLFKQKYGFKNNTFIYLIISIYLILQCASTGMFLGITIFLILEIFQVLVYLKTFIKNHIKDIVIIIYVFAVFATVYLIVDSQSLHFSEYVKNKFNDLKIIERIEYKFGKVNNEESNLLNDRGYDYIFEYPQYLIYGAGQGNYSRFYEKTGRQGEIHATFPSILFYYGIIPLFLILYWIFNKIKHLPLNVTIVYIALFIESFTLLNQRQAYFWIIILLGEAIRNKENSIQKM